MKNEKMIELLNKAYGYLKDAGYTELMKEIDEAIEETKTNGSRKKYIICILPTGDWAEINEENQVEYKTLNEEDFINLCNGEITLQDLQ